MQARATPVVVRMSLVGAAAQAPRERLDELPGKVNLFDRQAGEVAHQTSRPTPRSTYRAVYPGIDLVYYGPTSANWSTTSSFHLGGSGKDRARLPGRGAPGDQRRASSCCTQPGAPFASGVPVIYQEIDGVFQDKDRGPLRAQGRASGRFKVAAYDASRRWSSTRYSLIPLTSAAVAKTGAPRFAVDAAGNAYVTGHTESRDFPITTVVPDGLRGGAMSSGEGDAFVTKLNPTAPLSSTHLPRRQWPRRWQKASPWTRPATPM